MEAKQWRRIAGVVLGALAVLALMLLADHSTVAATGLVLAAGFPVVPKSYQELRQIAYPGQAGVPETIPFWWYDTQTIAAAGPGLADIPFFGAVAADRTLSNWVNAGSLPEPMFFAIWHVMADIFPAAAPFVSTTADTTGQLNNVGLLTTIGRPIITITLSQKDYGPWPFSLLHGTGGPVGDVAGTTAAAGSTQYANNGIFDGGMRLQGAIVIPPKTDFSLRLRYGLNVTPTVDQRVRITMGGVLYRAVK